MVAGGASSNSPQVNSTGTAYAADLKIGHLRCDVAVGISSLELKAAE